MDNHFLFFLLFYELFSNCLLVYYVIKVAYSNYLYRVLYCSLFYSLILYLDKK